MNDAEIHEVLRGLLRPAAGWEQSAACQGEPMDIFFPGRGESLSKAKAICAGCPVQAECLSECLINGEHFGIWGGLSERERKRLLRGRPVLRPILHGTPGGYRAHRRRGEEACDECKAAKAPYSRECRGDVHGAERSIGHSAERSA